MKETAKAILTYPFVDGDRTYNSVVTLLDRVAVKNGQTNVYGLPGGGIEKGESPMDALVCELREELGLEVKSARKVGKFGRHHLFMVEDVSGTVDQWRVDLSEVLGLGFLNSGPQRRIPNQMLQAHVRHVVSDLMGSIAGLERDWPKDVDPSYKIRGYFFAGNKFKRFYDWEQQQRIIKSGAGFRA